MIKLETIIYTRTIENIKYEIIDANQYNSICRQGGAYEYIPDDKPVKLYLNVGVVLPIDGPNDVIVVKNDVNNCFLIDTIAVKNDIISVLKDMFKENYNEDYICWKSSHGVIENQFKISYHIIINNIIALKSYQLIIVENLNKTASLICDNSQKYFPNGMFDKSIYSPEKQFIRSVFTFKRGENTKPGQNRYFKIESGKFQMTCITAFIPENAIFMKKTIWDTKKTFIYIFIKIFNIFIILFDKLFKKMFI